MQIDFHHTGTYAIARMAGFPHGEAATIAYAAQYVDDATNQGVVHFDNGDQFERIATAHQMASFENLENVQNEKSWMPFHFLPGNLGLEKGKVDATPMIRRLICTTDSHVANEMLGACTRDKGKPNRLHRLGITSHVYVDTWVHKEFTGLQNPINQIHGIETTHTKLKGLADKVASSLASALSIGHGAVLTFPDLPFATWSYTDRDGHPMKRKNPELFLGASKRLFAFYRAYQGYGALAEMKKEDAAVLTNLFTSLTDEKGETRHEGWVKCLREGRFSFGPLSSAEATDLNYVPKGMGSWKQKALGTTKAIDDPAEVFKWSSAFDTLI